MGKNLGSGKRPTAKLKVMAKLGKNIFRTTKIFRYLRVREDKGRGVYVDGVTECYTGCPEEMFELMERGANNRAVSATQMNADSSRSHSHGL